MDIVEQNDRYQRRKAEPAKKESDGVSWKSGNRETEAITMRREQRAPAVVRPVIGVLRTVSRKVEDHCVRLLLNLALIRVL